MKLDKKHTSHSLVDHLGKSNVQFDMISILQTELSQRCQKNPRYSLCSFARSLGVDKSLLSKILRRKKAISKKMSERLAQTLDIEKIPSLNSMISQNSRKYEEHTMTASDYELLSNWYFTAILELSQIKGFRGHPNWISKKLGISTIEASIAMNALSKFGYIKINKTGKWTLLKKNNTWGNTQVTSNLRRSLQRQSLVKAVESIDSISYDYRYNSSATFAVNVKKIEEIKSLITKFRKELMKFAEDNPPQQDVYQICIALFPLTDRLEKRRDHNE